MRPCRIVAHQGRFGGGILFEVGANNEEDELEELCFKKKVTLKARKANDPEVSSPGKATS